MQVKKQTTKADLALQKVFIVAGLSLIGIGIIANLYGTYVNSRFIHDALAFAYYFQHLLLLGGGFAIGYFMTRKTSGRRSNDHVFNGVFYALLANALYWLVDMLRLPIRSVFGDFPYPWGKVFFYGMVVIALIATLAIAYIVRRKAKQPQLIRLEKIIIILAFILSQIFSLATSMYYLLTGISSYEPNTVWMIITSYVTLPLVVTLVAYILLSTIKGRLDRLFYASLIGIFYSTLILTLWEFRTDASAEATTLFHNTVMTIALIAVGLTIWFARKGGKIDQRKRN